MDDLAGLDWTSSSSANKTKSTSSTTPAFSYPALQPTPPPLSGRSTPSVLSTQASGRQATASPFANIASKPATPANDSFSNLLATSKTKQIAGLSMQEQQRQLQEEKSKQEEARRKQFDSQFGMDDTAWGNLNGSGKSRPDPVSARIASPPNAGAGLSAAINKPFAALNLNKVQSNGDSDLLAAFSADAPVDKSSHFPAAASHPSWSNTPAHTLNSGIKSPVQTSSLNDFKEQEDDDPFGLASMPQRPPSPRHRPRPSTATDDDDEVLGLLGKPVNIAQKQSSRRTSPRPPSPDPTSPQAASTDIQDKAVAELVDMGFPADAAAGALAETGSGADVQAAVGILLNRAHEEAKQKSKGGQSVRRSSPRIEEPEAERPSRRDGPMPSWMREERSQSVQRKSNNQSPSQDKDVAQYASEFGTSMWKSANSLWKTSQKKVQKAVADFNADGSAADSSQPKWMRDAQAAERQPPVMRQAKQAESMTDEAALLEGGGRPQKATKQQEQQREPGFRDGVQRSQSRFNDGLEQPHSRFVDNFDRPASRPRSPPRQRAPPAATALPSSRGFKFDDDAATTAYTSSARRRGGTPKAASPAPQGDLFSAPTPPAPQTNGTTKTTPAASRPAASRPQQAAPPRPKAPPRQIPSVSPAALASSSQHRQAGSEAFKRGDYAAAHTSYTSALTALNAASSHPITIIILCNRATTNLKVGDPRAALADADRALEVIGPARGDGETIATIGDASSGSSISAKDMKDFYAKALLRKAEALEHMEKWADAAAAWRLAVEVGAGGAVAIQGRNRCEKAAAGNGSGSNTYGTAATTPATVRSQPPPAPARKVAPSKPAVPISRPSPASTAASADAVRKLRAQHAAETASEDEKFALADSVAARLAAWKGGKADNLRALLGSLETVLWEGAGWTKVGMGELVLPGRVKVVYMRAIGRCHPDKIPQDATTEQRMISGAVFSTLNEAWDKFKAENGL